MVESPGCPLAPAALAELERAITFYEEGSTTRIPSTTVTMLERLRDRAKIAFAQSQSGLGPQPSVDESEFPDDVAIISGRASVINRSGSSQSPNSNSRPSESPQTMSVGISGLAASPHMSPMVSDARAYNVHGNVMSMGDMMQDFGLEYYSPNHTPALPHQHPQYMNGVNDMNGMNTGGVGMNGVGGMNMNNTNGSMNQGSGGMLPHSHLTMDHTYGDPHSQQLYTMDIPHTYHQQEYGHSHSQVAALPLHGPGGREEIWMNFMHQMTTTDGNPQQNGYQPQIGHPIG